MDTSKGMTVGCPICFVCCNIDAVFEEKGTNITVERYLISPASIYRSNKVRWHLRFLSETLREGADLDWLTGICQPSKLRHTPVRPPPWSDWQAFCLHLGLPVTSQTDVPIKHLSHTCQSGARTGAWRHSVWLTAEKMDSFSHFFWQSANHFSTIFLP